MLILPSAEKRQAIGAFLVLSTVCAVLAFEAACRGPHHSVEALVERHKRAVAELPEQDRSRLMLCEEPPGTGKVDGLVPDGVLDLETARSLALRANPDIHAALARLEAAAARVDQARALYFPTVGFTHTSVRTFHTPASRNRLAIALQPTPNIPTDALPDNAVLTALVEALRRPLFGPDQDQGNRNSFSEHSTAFTFGWTAFDGFVRQAQTLAAKYLHQAARDSLIDVQRLLIQAVDTAYYQVQLAGEQLRIAQADEEFSKEQLEETEKLREAGRASQADVDNFRIRMIAAQASVRGAHGLAETGRVALAELMGLPDAQLTRDLTLAGLEDETEEEMETPQPKAWLERAHCNRPDLRQSEHVLSSAEENVRAVKGLYSPTVTLSGSWGYDRSSTLRYTVEDQSSAAGVELRWDLYTGGSRRSRVLEAESNQARRAAELNRLRLAVTAQVRAAVIDVGISQEQIRLQRENLAVAKETRRMVKAGYAAGTENLTRLNEAQRDVIAADADLTLARIRLRLAWSDLNAAAATCCE